MDREPKDLDGIFNTSPKVTRPAGNQVVTARIGLTGYEEALDGEGDLVVQQIGPARMEPEHVAQFLSSINAFRTVVTDNVNPLDGDIKELSSRFHELNISITKLEERDRLTKLIEGLTRDGK